MSDNELDNLFKEAADEFKAPSDPSAWQDMSRKLDQAVVVTSFWNWKTISSLTIVGVTSIALVIYLSMPDSNSEKVVAADGNLSKVIVAEKNADSKPAVNDQEVNSPTQNLKDKNDLVEREGEQSKKADESKRLDQSNSKVKLKEENSDNKPVGSNEVNSANQSLTGKTDLVEKESDQSKKVDQGKKLDQNAGRSVALGIESTGKSNQTLNTKGNTVQSESLPVIQSESPQQKTQSLKQETPDQNQTGVTKNSTDNKDDLVSSDRKPEQKGALIAEAAVMEKTLDTKISGSSVIEGNSNQSTSNTKLANQQTENSSANIDSLKKEEEKKELAKTTLLSKTDEQPEEKKSESINRFAIKLAISPDYSTVKSATPNSLGINYGVLFEYKLNERWSVATGGIWSKKIYSANDVEYNGYNADWVDGDCRMWDIPINVYYNFPSRKQFSFYASVGLSSYLMNEENYVYYVESSYGTHDYAMQVKGENNEWFKTLNVSAGMQFRMSKIVSLQFEPTLKAPLAGVGEGEVSLVSLGAFLNLRFDLPLNKTRRNED